MCNNRFADQYETVIDNAILEQDWEMVELLQDLFEVAREYPPCLVEHTLNLLQGCDACQPCRGACCQRN